MFVAEYNLVLPKSPGDLDPLERATRSGVHLCDAACGLPPIDRRGEILLGQSQRILGPPHDRGAVWKREPEVELCPAAQPLLAGSAFRREWSAPACDAGMGGFVHDGRGDFRKRDLRIHGERELHQALPGCREEGTPACKALYHEAGEIGAKAPVASGRVGGNEIERRGQALGDLLRLNVRTRVNNPYRNAVYHALLGL